MSGLDPTYKRLLQGEMSQSSSSNSLNINTSTPQARSVRSRQASVTGSSENLIDDHKVRLETGDWRLSSLLLTAHSHPALVSAAGQQSDQLGLRHAGQEAEQWDTKVVRLARQGELR